MNTTAPSTTTTSLMMTTTTGQAMNKSATSENMKYVWVNWFHFLVVGPLLLFVGIKGKSTPQLALWLLAILAVVVILYHLWILSKKMSHPVTTKKEGFASSCPLDGFACA